MKRSVIHQKMVQLSSQNADGSLMFPVLCSRSKENRAALPTYLEVENMSEDGNAVRAALDFFNRRNVP
jgi:hypothetical protein